MRVSVNAKSSVNTLLKLCSLRPKPLQHVCINVNRDGNFVGHTQFSVTEKGFVQWWNVRGVDLFIGHLVNSRPVGL